MLVSRVDERGAWRGSMGIWQRVGRPPTLAVLLMTSAIGPAAAQGLSCTGFLHNKDGSWRSLEDGPVLGPNGRIALRSGEILRPTDRSEKGDIARALNGLCEGE